MGLLNIIAIGLGLAMDAFAVSVSCGLAVASVRIRYALKLALCFAFFQALMPTVGWLAFGSAGRSGAPAIGPPCFCLQPLEPK